MIHVKKLVDNYKEEVTFTSLKKFIDELDLSKIDYKEHLVEPASSVDYGRNIFNLTPFECVLIHWPEGLASAVHLHNGLFGYVLVLEGEISNHFYRENGRKLEEFDIHTFKRGDLIPEPDGVIHKIKNKSKEECAVTLHFYYPALDSMEGLKIYNLKHGKIGILSDQAESACWKDEPGHFLSVEENAFEYVPFSDSDSETSSE